MIAPLIFYLCAAMPLFKEKRAGQERRLQNDESNKKPIERRSVERRQIALEEISFIEWARQFASYKKQNSRIK